MKLKLFENFYQEVRLDEISDRANIDIDWDFGDENGSTDSTANFTAGGEKFDVSVDESNPGYFTVTFQNSGGYSQTGKQGHGAAAVFSGVLTCLREFTEHYESVMDKKPYSFDFSAAYELPQNHPQARLAGRRQEAFELPLDEKKKLLKDLISRPMLYYSLSLTFGKEQGYSTHMHDRLLTHLAGNANDFRSVRKNVTRNIVAMDDAQVDKALREASGSVSFTLTNDHERPSDYDSPFGQASLEDHIDDASQYEVEEWINEGREDEIIEHADWQTLVRIATWGLMHDELIYHDDSDVRWAVVKADYEYGDKLAESPEWEHRKEAAENGFMIYQLVVDDDEDVREAAWDWAFESEDSDQRIEYAKNVDSTLGRSHLEDVMDRMIDDSDDYEDHVFVAEHGWRLEELVDNGDEDVREAAMNWYFNNEDSTDAVSNIMSHSDVFGDENLSYIMNGNFGPYAEEKAIEMAKEADLDVSEWVTEATITDYTLHDEVDEATSVDVEVIDSDGSEFEVTVTYEADTTYTVNDTTRGKVETFDEFSGVFEFFKDEYGIELDDHSEVYDHLT
ncbi:hypothetical protein VPHK567_0131 [Vibrio phage K567]